MRKLTAGLLFALSVGILPCPVLNLSSSCYAQKAEVDVEEEANILYEEALELKQQGNLPGAIEAYMNAMRKDRSILAFDDGGLIEDLKKNCEDKLEKDPSNVKTLETLGFVNAVCYSDYNSAISYYEKVVELVDDEAVKDKTNTLIARLKATSEAQQQYQTEVVSQMREERLKSWSEMERVDKFGQETAAAQEKSRQLANMYKEKDSLKNRVPQLEQELKDLKEEYEKANRMWYSLKEDLYYRKRRRLKDDIAVKEKEVEEATEQLADVEDNTARLEREVQLNNQQQNESPVKTYDNYAEPEQSTPAEPDQNAGGDSPAEDEEPVAPPSNDYGAPADSEPSTEEPLPAVDNPDFPRDETESAEPTELETPEEREKRLQDLINSL